MHETTVVIPIKSFRTGWSRLAGHLDDRHRRSLAVTVADRVIAAAGALPVLIVTNDDGVRDWATMHRLATLAPVAPGLNRAVGDALAHLESGHLDGPDGAGPDGADVDPVLRALVVHADLPLASDLSVAVGAGDEVIIVTDRHDDGTNLLSIPLRRGFEVSYGVGSAARHRSEAARLGLGVTTITDPELSWDLDTPEDLDHPQIQELLERVLGAIP